jgi:hypothetical protein
MNYDENKQKLKNNDYGWGETEVNVNPYQSSLFGIAN